MANGLKTTLTRLCRYLQDPNHVASFQQLCGVKGTFPPQNTTEDDLTSNGVCVKQGLREEDVGPKQRNTASNRWQQNDCSKGLPNGEAGSVAADEPNAGRDLDRRIETGHRMAVQPSELSNDEKTGVSMKRAKPLRKNSLTGEVGQEFIINNQFLFYLFTFGTELGNEMFFIVFFPFLMWNVDAFVSRQLIVVWIWNLFFGQCAKDLIRWTRPTSPPVVKVEIFYNLEYSMPSTHAMSGTAIPFCLFLLTYGRWQYPFLIGLSVAICWSILVCISRIYMGMHSILEVISGFLFSLLILACFKPFLAQIDSFYLMSPYASLVIVTLHVSLGLLAFSLDSWSTSRGDTAQALGTGAGAALASHLNYQLGLLADPALSALPLYFPSLSTDLLVRIGLRLLIGVSCLLAVRATTKAITVPLVCRVLKVPCDNVREARQNMMVELPYRYVVYGSISFSCVFVVPLLFSCLNIS
ncbi:sphingosine-1-phosphate phosphatase 1-like [Osmerus eperlanus]|uniref:sphingosine-1-phosphate phosphatase 1-like n=1 Tax=Osmerus eperlanus TaxID=29151 RepID=UPI002E0DBDFA